MLKVLRSAQRNVPMLCCDACGSWIDDASLAAAVFRYTEEGNANEVLLTHKGACHRVAEERLSGETPPQWLELSKYLLHATHNAGLPPSALVRLADDEDQYGELP
jgi:FMN-dependent NADH-azoreductase